MPIDGIQIIKSLELQHREVHGDLGNKLENELIASHLIT